MQSKLITTLSGLALTMSAVFTLSAFGAASVSADNPEPFPESFSFPEINPCTGEEFVVTIDVVIRFHQHQSYGY